MLQRITWRMLVERNGRRAEYHKTRVKADFIGWWADLKLITLRQIAFPIIATPLWYIYHDWRGGGYNV